MLSANIAAWTLLAIAWLGLIAAWVAWWGLASIEKPTVGLAGLIYRWVRRVQRWL